jgi:hypothetical protein
MSAVKIGTEHAGALPDEDVEAEHLFYVEVL